MNADRSAKSSTMRRAAGAWLNTRLIRRAKRHKELVKLKRQTGKDIFVGGSHLMWNDLLANGLMDELRLMVGPVVVGASTSIFKGRQDVSFRLIDMRKWKGSENVLIRYEVGPKKAGRPNKKGKSKRPTIRSPWTVLMPKTI